MSLQPLELAQQLYDLQKRENEGAGVPIIREIIEALRHDKPADARRIADWGWNQIRSYIQIAELLERELF